MQTKSMVQKFVGRGCLVLAFLFVLTLAFTGCNSKETKIPEIPNSIAITEYEEPVLSVYVVEDKKIENMPLEMYLEGVVAGEMYTSWPLEALKAQAILARTYTLHFVKNKGNSKYEGADISTDISEAQAYNKNGINDRVKQAVRETRGVVLANDGEFIESWFHSNSGGKTASVKEGLGGNETPEFVKIATSPETERNAQNTTWSATFAKTEILNALRKLNISVPSVSNVSVSARGESGRALTLNIGGKTVDAPALRLALGSTKMKSTYLTNIETTSTSVIMQGKGYGHGVGLSQWGAKILAEEGKTAKQIVQHYYQNIDVVKLYT